MTNLAASLEHAAIDWRERTAFEAGGESVSHEAVHFEAARTGSLLTAAGVAVGDRVLIAVPDSIEFVQTFLGAVRLGAIAVPVNPRLTAGEHRRIQDDCRPRVVVCASGLADRFAGQVRVIDIARLRAESSGLEICPAVALQPHAPAYAQYTSGTTGEPKAAVHRHSDPSVYHQAFATTALNINADDVVLSLSKMYFAYGLGNSLFFPLMSGARAVLHAGSPGVEEVVELVERHRVTLLFSVPTFYARLVGFGAPSETFASLRAAISAGETLPVALLERGETLLGCPLLDGFGSTEVGQTFVSNTPAVSRPGTVGRPLAPYEVVVRHETSVQVRQGEVGALWVRGPSVLLEYLGRPEASAAAVVDGWLRTGDRASIDADGFVHLQGRVDDLEMVGGITVAPQEIEGVLAAHGQVVELAVASVRDELGASHLEAFVVLAAAPEDPESLASELQALAATRLAPYKVPRIIRFVHALPRTPTGKLRRFELRSGTWR